MSQSYYINITDFSAGQNNEFDPRAIAPNEAGDPAEAVLIENYDITEKGALVTANGYEALVSVATGAPMQYTGVLTYNSDYRDLIAVSDQDVFSIRKKTSTILHDCNVYNSGTYGTFTGSDDASAVATEASSYIRGSGAVKVTVTAGASASNYATVEVDPLTSVDLTDADSLELICRISNVTNFTSVTIRFGSSSSDYYEYTETTDANGNTFITDPVGIRLDLSSLPTATGSPDISAIDYLMIRFNYTAAYTGGTIYIDDIRASEDGDTYEAIDITGNLWTATAPTLPIVNGENYTGDGSIPYHILVSKGQQPLKVRHVGPGMLITETITSAPSGAYIVAQMTGFLFMVDDRTVYYGASEDEDNFGGGGTIGFPSHITALAPTVNKTMLIGMEDNLTEAVSFSFDDTTLTYTPIRDEYQAGVGVKSHKSVQKRYNDSIFLGNEGVAYFGQEEGLGSDNYRINSLSWKIDKRLRNMNKSAEEVAAGFYFSPKKEYGIAIPLGADIENNNRLYVYKSQYDSWIYRSGVRMAHATEYREDNDVELIFGDSSKDEIYKFNAEYDYDGEAYVRRYTFKTFTMGYPMAFKRLEYISVAGAMPVGSEFYVVVRGDGVAKTFKVTDDALITDVEGGYIGDEFYGEEFYGGEEVEDEAYQFYRFYQMIPIPKQIMEAREFEVEFYYEAAGKPHKIDFFGGKYTFQPEAKIPGRHINDEVLNLNIIPSDV